MHLLSVIGTRPQAVKAFAIQKVLESHFPHISHTIVDTGQHYDEKLSSKLFEGINVAGHDVNLRIGSGSHAQTVGAMLPKLEQILVEKRPDWCLNYGDTNTTLATAIAAAKLNCKTAHIEAGMRRYDLSIPEEVNRRITDHVSTVLFTSSEYYSNQLRRENVPGDIVNTGDINFDAFGHLTRLIADEPRLYEYDFVLATIHRPINTDNSTRFYKILQFLESFPYKVIFPIHPRTEARIDKQLIKSLNNIKIVRALNIEEMMLHIRDCKFVATDSGGVQKEAYFGGKFCLTLNDDTPWIELKDMNVNLPIPFSSLSYDYVKEWLNRDFPKTENPYGDGQSACKIIRYLENYNEKQRKK